MRTTFVALLLGVAVLSMGCGIRYSSTPPSLTPVATVATPTATPLSPSDLAFVTASCKSYGDDLAGTAGFKLTVTPDAPKAGQIVRVVGTGLPAGGYTIQARTPQTDGGPTITLTSVGTDGGLDASGPMPASVPSGTCIAVVAVSSGGSVTFPAKPFVVP